MDLSKAFDTIDHNILLYKLKNYGIRGIALQWLKSYLSDRQQYVFINRRVNLREKTPEPPTNCYKRFFNGFG